MLLAVRSDWYCFRTVSASSHTSVETTPSLFLVNGLTEESWTVVVARRVTPWPDRQRGEFLRDVYSLAWLRSGASNYEKPPEELAVLFHEEVVTFTTALTLKGILTPGYE